MNRMEWSDEQAVAQARGGDHDAFRALVERHTRSLFRLGFRMMGNEHDAEEVVQEALIRAYRRLDKFEERSNFGTWIYRIAVNCALDLKRVRQRDASRRETVPEPEEESSSPMDLLPTQDASPERLAMSVEVQREVHLAMQKLTDVERAAFVMRHFDGCSVEEISAALDLKTSAAKNTVFRAVQKLRASLLPLVSPAK
ncbi:MAG: sigma-70 family RNA polymerase sigma factor [Acidobacteria bacterium]|nr:sigma-70 family RNA polymerase sigma factor [Acidobacteriota bacterium]